MLDDISQAVLAREEVNKYPREQVHSYLEELRTTQRHKFYRALQHPLYPILRKIERKHEHLHYVSNAVRSHRVGDGLQRFRRSAKRRHGVKHVAERPQKDTHFETSPPHRLANGCKITARRLDLGPSDEAAPLSDAAWAQAAGVLALIGKLVMAGEADRLPELEGELR